MDLLNIHLCIIQFHFLSKNAIMALEIVQMTSKHQPFVLLADRVNHVGLYKCIMRIVARIIDLGARREFRPD